MEFGNGSCAGNAIGMNFCITLPFKRSGKLRLKDIFGSHYAGTHAACRKNATIQNNNTFVRFFETNNKV